MAKKVFKVDILSKSSVEKLKKDLEDYRRGISEKCERVVNELVAIGQAEIESRMSEAQITYDGKNIQSGADTSHYTSVKITSLIGYTHADISISGKEVMFIEFGSGVYHNGIAGASPHPKGQEFGFVIGSYGQHKGVQQVWGYYDDNGDLVFTHGVKATMPMYSAIMKMYQEAPRIVKSVFGGV